MKVELNMILLSITIVHVYHFIRVACLQETTARALYTWTYMYKESLTLPYNNN